MTDVYKKYELTVLDKIIQYAFKLGVIMFLVETVAMKTKVRQWDLCGYS